MEQRPHVCSRMTVNFVVVGIARKIVFFHVALGTDPCLQQDVTQLIICSFNQLPLTYYRERQSECRNETEITDSSCS